MGAQQFNSDADRREYSRWVKEMQAKRDQYGWIRWDDARPPEWETVQIKREFDFGEPVRVKVADLASTFNVTGVSWRTDSQAQH